MAKVKVNVAVSVATLPMSRYTKNSRSHIRSIADKRPTNCHLLCCPAFVPQILGDDKPEEPVRTKESIQPSVVVVAAASPVVDGPTMAKTSKSSLEKMKSRSSNAW